MVRAATRHPKNANLGIPPFGNEFQRFFEIIVVLLREMNNGCAALRIILECFRGNRIEIANDGMAGECEAPRMFRALVCANDEPRARDNVRRNLADLTAKNNKCEFVQA